MVGLRWCESLAKAPLQATTRGAGLARVGFPVPGVRGALEGCPCKLPICCADTDAIVAIIKHPKTATPATTTDPATIVLPPHPGSSEAASAGSSRRRRTLPRASPHFGGTPLEADSSRNCVTK